MTVPGDLTTETKPYENTNRRPQQPVEKQPSLNKDFALEFLNKTRKSEPLNLYCFRSRKGSKGNNFLYYSQTVVERDKPLELKLNQMSNLFNEYLTLYA